ncbi:sulfite exporter TauE/SafE family protein, partial [Ellagibacter isourolithinifaciens]|uniref:sulfite exporter TauE/SafE family protein n=1 Tax=Ellagibacter isourolithinifaciens TaxID=2137581 RepID=UPI003FD8E1B5
MVEVLVHFVAPALVGVLIGIASGLLGIGGGTVMVPIFRLVFGMSATMSTATSLFAIIPTSISGAISHVKGKTCIPALGIAAGLGGACLSPVGVWLAQLSPDWLVMLAAALIIGYSAINMFKKAFKLRPAGQT